MRPLPVPQPESALYWEKLRDGELWLRRCNACALVYFYPRDLCPRCFSRDTGWIRSGGRGALHTFSIVHRPPTPDWRDAVPYVVALVELDEGARVPTNLVDVTPDPAHIRVGMRVAVAFRKLSEDITVPVFRPDPSPAP